MSIPAIGLGTYKQKDEVIKTTLRHALDLGYRAIDTAQIYHNEAAIGEALAASGHRRDTLFITTKIWTENLSRDKLIPSLRESLTRLQTDYVDLTLIHWPSSPDNVSLEEYMQALLEAKREGLTRAIGVSNFTVAQMQQAVAAVGEGEIAVNQVELSPFLQNRDVVAFARRHGIAITSYMTLCGGKVLEDETLKAIALAHSATPVQIALAWALAQGYSVIPSSTRRENLAGNLMAGQIALTEDEMAAIAELECGMRLNSPQSLSPAWD